MALEVTYQVCGDSLLLKSWAESQKVSLQSPAAFPTVLFPERGTMPPQPMVYYKLVPRISDTAPPRKQSC
jgi:hypothetical protein